MKVKNIVVVLLSVITVFSTIVTGSAVNAYGGLLYSEDDNPSLLKIVGISAELSEKTIITVPSSVYGKAVTKIDRSAFSRTANIQGFSFTSTLLTICDNALFGMPDLQEITLPKNIQSVGRSAFASCISLKNVTFRTECLSVVRKYTFFNCSSLENVILSPSVFQLEERCFGNCPELQKIYIPSSVKNIDDTVFENSENVTIYGVENSEAYRYAQRQNIPFVCTDKMNYEYIDKWLSDIHLMTFDGSANLYTADTFSNLMTAYENAQRIRNDILSSQTDIDTATTQLQNSFQSLVLANIADLQEIVATAQDYKNHLYQYTTPTAENFQTALADAEKVLVSSDNTYFLVQNTITTLNKSINALTSVTKGDINGDCHVRLKDAVLVQKYLLDMTSFDDRMFYCADFNNDGRVTLSDVILIQRYVIKN